MSSDQETHCPPCHNKPSRHIFRLPAIDFKLADAVKTDVTFQVFKNNSTSGAYYTDLTISSTKLDPDIPLKIIIHGWLSNETTYWYEPFRDALFKRGRHNCVYIDWYKSGGKKYDIAAANARLIGGFIADFIIASSVQLKNVHVIGHSLGSQVAGFTGKAVIRKTGGQKIGRITLTDPAALMFELPEVPKEDKAGDGDAEFVDVIHSDIGHYGYIDPIGHVDFYPNGGKDQPGCPPLEDDGNIL